MTNPLDQAKELLKRAKLSSCHRKDSALIDDINAFLRSQKAPEDSGGTREGFLVTTEADGFETVLGGDDVYIVPIETLDLDRREQLESGDWSKILKHGGGFPSIPLQEFIDIADAGGVLRIMIGNCRQQAEEIAKGKS